MTDTKKDRERLYERAIGPKVGLYGRRVFVDKPLKVEVVKKKDGTVNKAATKKVNSNNTALENYVYNEATTMGQVFNKIFELASKEKAPIIRASRKVSKGKASGGKVYSNSIRKVRNYKAG